VSSDEPSVVVPSPRPVAMREIQLVDRVEEMRLLREAADRAISGEGGVVFVYGEAGIGKTRLARELGAYARSRGMQVLSGRCPALFRMDGVPPYVLWKEVIKDFLEVCTPEQLYRVIGFYPVEVSKLVPELRQKLRTFPESFPISPEYSRDRLFEAVSQFVTNISREKPMVVILDDLQWTDQSSLLLLHYLARGIYKESLLLLGAYRDTYVDKGHPLRPVLTELNRERLLHSVPLKRFSFDHTVEIIKGMLEQDEVPSEFCKLIYDKTMGNPFFVEEVVNSLKEEGIIYREKKKWKIKAVSRIEFPETVKDVIKKRMGLLDGESQRVLTLASFIGKDFTFKALREVTETKEDRLLEILEKMTRAGFVKQSVVHGEDVCSFTDIIVRDVAYEEVSPLRRKKLHGVVGRTLEKVYAKKIEDHLGELALHFLESGDQEKALDYFLKAGEKAAKVYANIEAASYFQSALQLLEKKEDVLREQQYVLEKLGDIQRLVGELDSSMKYWSDAVQLARQLRGEGNISRLYRKMANILWDELGDTKRAKEHHDKALKILESKPESVELASLYEDLAHMYYRTGDMTNALSWAEKALNLAKQLNAYEVISNSYASLGTIFSFTGNKSKGAECLEKSLKIALDNGHMETALRAYNNLASVLPAEESQRRLECTEKGFELGRKIGHIGLTSFIGTNLAWAYLEMGKLNEALSLAEESLALDRKSNNLPNLAFSLAALGWIHHRAGDWVKSEQYYKESLDLSQRINEFQQAAGVFLIRGGLHFDKGEYATARELQEKSIKILKKVGATELQMQYSRFLAWTYLELGEIEKAGNLIDGLHKYALEREDKEAIANAAWLRAMLLRAQKKWDESIEYFEKSLKEWEALDARKWAVYWFARQALCEYARLYVERGQEGDQEKALDLLSQALEIFQNTGAKKDIEKVEATIAYLETGRGKIVEREPVPTISQVVLPDRISTGYADLDELLSGGLPRDFAVLLMSPSCDERDFLVKRFLENGIRNSEITFYITIDPGKVKALVEESPTDFYVFICNPQADKIIKDLPNVFRLKGVENLTDVNIALTSAFRRLERTPRRACVEIVSDVLLQHHAVHTRRWLTSLLPELRSHGFTTLAVMDPGMHPSQEVRALLDLFEGEIRIRKEKTKKFLKIEKMANQEYSDSELPLEKGKL